MPISFYTISFPPIIHSLSNLREILEKAATYAQARQIDPIVLVNARLYPDMYPLSRQVQIVMVNKNRTPV